ncbi:hypothetical protein GR702_18570 [Novosphingobium sp. FGD1]|jgi:hypothetical protein|uniref:Antifreeze protein n=1 Tax=Novosphingobium silvae TaxID=2692619 RepID=A0A7X4GKB4_9SPHN|nr:hypothetical protein [Novosphingobium silvae]MYL99766.1 hypothetical protein [Novosphingobium silvae]
MKNHAADWLKLTHDSYWLWAESMMVIGMRTSDMMTGRGSERENALMVSEKVKAAADLGMQMAMGGMVSPQAAVSHYRRKVTANRRRLARKKTK